MIIYHGSNIVVEDPPFNVILNVIATGLVGKIIEETKLNEDVAIEKLYSSKLYSFLETEDTDVWHYSVHKLYNLWSEEMNTGKLVLPEY